ncbi:hypothetical protein [Roseisalinus antarcticus]|uniref:hypothetical protein n=1 Tax=Roseisalinus antarcticus TaxID=254357 RepID=UPI0013562F6F|nr:hypothetical protein [Roseisalinus antarcticus]
MIADKHLVQTSAARRLPALPGLGNGWWILPFSIGGLLIWWMILRFVISLF